MLIICSQDGKAAAAAAEEAKKAGVKVIAYDRLITDTDAVDFFATLNNFLNTPLVFKKKNINRYF